MVNSFQKILGTGKENVTEEAKETIYQMLLHGSRKSAVLSTMLERGFDKNQLKEVIDEKALEVRNFKNSDEGIKTMVEINNKRIKNGLIGIVFGVVLTVVGYLISGVFDALYFYVFYGAILWGIYSLVRGLFGLVLYKRKKPIK